MKPLKNPAEGTARHRGMIKQLADSIKQPGLRRPMMSPEERKAIMDAAHGAALDRMYKKHSARVEVRDGWANFMTGLGTVGRDKRTANEASWGLTLPENVSEDLFAADSLARRIVEIMPADATREWIEFDHEADIDPLESEMERLQVKPRCQEAWDWARLHGGAGILINDGTPAEEMWKPLRSDSLEQIVSLTVLTRWELWAWATDVQRDISRPDFGLPLRYHIYPRMAFGQVAITVHASRVIRFEGKKLPRLLHIRNNFWGDSVLTPIYDALGDFRVSHHAVANVLQDFRILVHGIAGLSTKIAAGGEQAIVKRMELMNMARSVAGVMLIDKDEDEIEYHSSSVAGVSDLVDKVCKLLQALTDIPHTILFNEAPGGAGSMGSSGDHEERNWFNTVKAAQVGYLKPRLDQIMKLIFAQKRGPFKGKEPKNWKYEFKPLWQMDDKEAATAYQLEAQGDQVYMEAGVATNQQIQQKRFPEFALTDPAKLLLQISPQKLANGDDPGVPQPPIVPGSTTGGGQTATGKQP